ncbi:hypothetical protein P4S73_02850 [Paraglaciecola sp. Hal342]
MPTIEGACSKPLQDDGYRYTHGPIYQNGKRVSDKNHLRDCITRGGPEGEQANQGIPDTCLADTNRVHVIHRGKFYQKGTCHISQTKFSRKGKNMTFASWLSDKRLILFITLYLNAYFHKAATAPIKMTTTNSQIKPMPIIIPVPIMPEFCIIPPDTCSVAGRVVVSIVNVKNKNERIKFFIGCLQLSQA